MKIKIDLLVWSSIVILCNACVKPFTPDIPKYEGLLVVDGYLTDGPGPYTITLSKSSAIKKRPDFEPYRGCNVVVKDNMGTVFALTEKSPGIYQTDSASMRGVQGRKYQLMISTPDGEQYESKPQELLKPVGIHSVYEKFEQHNGREGYQFYLDSEKPSEKESYFQLRLQCSYKFKADFPIYFYYDGGGWHPVNNIDTFRTCYRTINLQDWYLLNTGNLTDPQVKHFPLNYEDTYTKALSIRYTLKVSQYTLTKEAYTYWNTVKKMMDTQGEIYTEQPFQVENNLLNLTDPAKPALGYFTVAGLAENRIFVNAPLPMVLMKFPKCELNSDPIPEWLLKNPKWWPIFVTDPGMARVYVSQDCLDCRLTGTQTKPSFWID